MSTATVFEAKARLSALIHELEKTGEPVIITRHGKPVARLIPEPPAPEAESLLKNLQHRVREQGVRYDWDEVNRPLGATVWGDLAGEEPTRP